MPRKSSITPVMPPDFVSDAVSNVYSIWHSHAANSRVPTRRDLLPKPVGPFLRNIVLQRWKRETDEYEIRFIGDAHIQAYGIVAQAGQRASEFFGEHRDFLENLKRSCDQTRLQRAPLAYRGTIGPEFPKTRFSWLEALYLPLRDSGDDVEYVLNVAVYSPHTGVSPT